MPHEPRPTACTCGNVKPIFFLLVGPLVKGGGSAWLCMRCDEQEKP